MSRFALLFAAALALVAGPAAAERIAIVGGTVITMGPEGKLDTGTVLLDGDRIEAVRAGDAAPDGYRVVDAHGKIVTPGIFAANTALGAVEVSLEESTRDTGVSKEAPFSAAFDISYGINPRASAIPVSRIEGITRAAVVPGGRDHLFSGYGALIHLGDAKDIVTHPRAFAVASLGASGAARVGGARGAAVVYFVNAMRDADRYARMRNKNDFKGLVLSALDAEALGPVMRGEVPLLITANRASDITQILKLRREMPKLRIAIVGAEEGWMVADDLAAAKVPVIVHPFQNLPGDFSRLAATQANAARLAAAGVAVTIADESSDGHNPRLVLQYAGNAVANGMKWEDAFAAITINPARLYGVADEVGSLERGKTADVVVWDGDPLEVMSSPDAVFIRGEAIPLVSRQTKLRDRYKDLKGKTPFAYRK
ncbi:MAG: amidohydrolase [Alphaproteobacteria bacterium]|nr:MAG: amidohydrolase [Alphaproteobacteria bacterium]